MRNKIISVLLVLAILNMGLVFAVSAIQPNEQSKGGFNVEAFDLTSRKPSKPPSGGGGKPSGGIASGTVAEFSGDRYAIIIGISDYYGEANDLDYCDDDALDFQSALPGTYQVTLLIDDEATRDSILTAISSLIGKVDADDEVVFFYSGHGSVGSNIPDGDSERKDECIVPWEATWDSLIWDGELAAAFSGFTCRIMFYFDSCYAGGMTDLAGPNRLICMACGENQLSLESSAWEHGQFTYYFVHQGMINGFADADGENGVTFEEAFDYAKANCQRQSPVASDQFDDDMLP